MRESPSSSRRGFTIVELLVSISIMAVLIGILIPTLPRVMDSARRTACMANLKGIGEGVFMYTQDHNDKYPSAKYMPDPWLSADDDPPLNVAIRDYIPEDTPAYRCPGDRVVYDYEYEVEDGVFAKCGMSYTYVATLSNRTFEDSFYFRFLRRTPVDTPVAYDYDGGTFETQDGEQVTVDFFHSKRSVLFVDGHVDTYQE